MAHSLIIRPAVQGDRAAMLEITRDVWEGTDYVPFVWERWLEDPMGLLVVATQDGRVVGLQHHTLQPDGTAWLEGIRVAEDVRGKGIAKRLLADGIEWARNLDCPRVRLSTASANEATTRLARQAGFELIGRFHVFRGKQAVSPENASVRLGLPQDAPDIYTFVQRAMQCGQMIYTEGWTVYTLTEERLTTLLALKAVIVVGTRGVEGVAIATCRDPFTTLRVGLLLGDRRTMETLGDALLQRSFACRIPSVRATLSGGEAMLEAAMASGFEPAHDFEMHLHELKLQSN